MIIDAVAHIEDNPLYQEEINPAFPERLAREGELAAPRQEVDRPNGRVMRNLANLRAHFQGQPVPLQGQAQIQGEAEEANWNPMEWDRPAEELTWERLLGLDGSLLFLEHVFWVISLNTLFIIVRVYLN